MITLPFIFAAVAAATLGLFLTLLFSNNMTDSNSSKRLARRLPDASGSNGRDLADD